jgi:hypothetical protein
MEAGQLADGCGFASAQEAADEDHSRALHGNRPVESG